MSTAFFPLGMNNNLNPQGYVPWKGVNPSGSTSGTIRPLTNKDPTNDSSIGFGLPRPIKHARKGRDVSVLMVDPNNPTMYVQSRLNKSSNTGSLVKQLIDTPGGFTVAQNDASLVANTGVGIKVVSSNFLNLKYLTEKPSVKIENTVWPGPCFDASANNVPSFSFCNPERNARRRSMYASTNLKKNYYTRLEEYRFARCKTFIQNEANFKNYDNDYIYSNDTPPVPIYSGFDEVGCPCVAYKPNNPQFCIQGAVASSTLMLKLNVDTISTNAASLKNAAGTYLNVNDLNQGSNPANVFIYKNKVPVCVKKNCVPRK
jgi:hypothetical protein